MAKINILSKEVYQLIAAGEVVERPSSIVKEMIENSIDAGAKNITVEIKNGGITYIRITDDGCGIEKSEIKKVFIPHATSKISNAQDLDAIFTLGFRGEAMASIGAVSRVEILTKADGEDIGSRFEISGGEEGILDDAGCPKGTTIVVRDLFYNTPARMKFLKKDVTEGNSVAGVVDRMAISHPEISFRFIRDGKQLLVTSGNGELKSAAYSVFGKEISQGFIPVDYSYNNMRVVGLVSTPITSRKSRAMQFFFINNRLIKSTTALAALEQAYKNSIMVGRFPMCILNIEINPHLVDVNVHPAKIEVRFADEKEIFDLIYYGVKSAIEQDTSVKQVDFNKNKNPFINSNTNDTPQVYTAKLDLFKKRDEPLQQVFKATPKNDFWQSSPSLEVGDTFDEVLKASRSYNEQKNDLTTAACDNKPEAKEADSNSSVEIVDENNKDVNVRLIGEAFKTYLIAEVGNELYLVDKHAAHERMNYERLKSSEKVEVQMLLSPVVVNLTKDELNAISQNIDLFAECGFEIEVFGDSSVIARAIPSLVLDSLVDDLITELAQKLLDNKTDITLDKIDWIYHSASCRGAIKAGDNTSVYEQQDFLKKLFSMPEIRFCPHGRPVFIKMSKYDIEKQFGRV